MSLKAITLSAILSLVLVLPGCNQAEIEILKSASTSLRAELEILEADLATSEAEGADVARAHVARIRDSLSAIDERIQGLQASEAGAFGMLELIATGVAGIFPGAALAIPFIRAARRTMTTTFEAVAAGGGPQNPNLAGVRMRLDPKTALAFQKWKLRKAG